MTVTKSDWNAPIIARAGVIIGITAGAAGTVILSGYYDLVTAAGITAFLVSAPIVFGLLRAVEKRIQAPADEEVRA